MTRADSGESQPQLISVVVPVYNRQTELRMLLGELSLQEHPGPIVEIILCDDGSSENISQLAGEVSLPSWMSVRCLRLEHRGASAARNAGLAQSTGEIVAFTDSDCLPSPAWLRELVRPFNDPAIGLVGGHVDYRRAEKLSGRCVNYVMSSLIGGGARDPRCAIRMQYYPRSGNMAVRREPALTVGGFPLVTHGEDVEFSHLVLAQGFQQAFAPAATVLHNESRSLNAVGKESFRKGRARVRMASSAGVHELLHALPALFVAYVMILLAIGVGFPPLFVFAAAPLCIYSAVLFIVAVHAAVSSRDPRMAAALPIYALTMHIGYGLGYLWAIATLAARLPERSHKVNRVCQIQKPAVDASEA